MKKAIIILAALALVAGLAAFFWLRHSGNSKQAYVETKVERGSIRIMVATTGTVRPQNRVEIKPPIAGRIEEVFFEEGATLAKGDIIGLMSSTDRAALLDAARSKGAQEVAYWEGLYKPMPIIAPINGALIARNVEPGQTVASNEKMFVMADRLIVQAQIDETDIGRIKQGQEAELNLDAYPTDVVTGVVDAIAYDAQIINNVTMYLVDLLPSHVPRHMRSGMTANIQIVTAVTNDVLLLPSSCLLQERGRFTVLRPAPDGKGKPQRVPVQTGLNDGKRIEIVSGLNEGDIVLSSAARIPARKDAGTNPFMPMRRR